MPGRGDPLDLPCQGPGAQVEDPLVAAKGAVADVEQRVADEQPDQLAVGDVDDRLAGLGVAVAGLGVGKRADLEERRSGRCRAARRARPRRGSRAGRCDRWRARTPIRTGRAGRGRVPSRGPSTGRLQTRADGSFVEQLGEILDDDVGAVLAQRLGLADAVDPDDDPEAPGTPGLDPRERVLEDGRLAAGTPAPRPRRGRCRVRACR